MIAGIMNRSLKGTEGIYLSVLMALILIFLIFTTSFSQENKIRLNHYTIRQGLSQSCVTCMAQDSLGFIWIGTQDGLNRFDGYNFSVYRPVQGDSSSISDNSILCLYVDKSGTLWIGTENGGLDRFDNKTGTFRIYQQDPRNSESISSDCVLSISEDAAGNLWIGTYNGLDYFNVKKSEFIQFHHNKNTQSLSSDIVYSTYTDLKGNLWIGTQKGLNVYDNETKKFGVYYQNKNENSPSSNVIYSITGDKSGNVWIGTTKGLDEFNPVSKKFKHFKNSLNNPKSISSNVINAIYAGDEENIWIGTDTGGLNIYNTKTGLFTRFDNKTAYPEDAVDKQVVSLLKDKEGNIWVGTFGSGVYTFSTRPGQFDIIKVFFKNLDRLEENDISSICVDNSQNLWIGTNNLGLNKYDKKNKKFVHYSHTSSAGSISTNSVNTIFKDNKGTIWIGTVSGLDKYDPAADSFTIFKHDTNNTNSLGNNYVVTMAEDSSNNLWLGFSGGGIDKFDPVQNRFTHFKHNPSNINSLSSNDILNLNFDNKGFLWVGTDGSGLDRFDTKSGKFIHYTHNPRISDCLSHNVVFQTFQFPGDTGGTLWIGTAGGGLNELNTRTGKIKYYTKLNGLANNEIYGILGDKKGNLWMSTNFGISEFNTRSKTFRNFNVSDNLQSNEFNQGAFFEDKNGKMYFGGLEGLNAFFPDSIKSNRFNPEIQFTSYKNFSNRANNVGAIWTTKKINLSYKNNIIAFKFAALSYIDPSQNKFAYKLKGLNKDWIDNGTSNSVTFSNLSPGNYVLYVKGTNNDGIWSDRTASIDIVIAPPYWQTWWFRAFLAAALTALLFLIFGLRLRSIRRQNKKLETLVGERTVQLQSKTQELEKVNEKLNGLVKLLTKSEKELKELNLNKDKIMSVLAHDLKSPFNGLFGFTDYLANDIEGLDAGEIKEAAISIRNISGNLLKLLNNLLDWSLVQSGSLKYNPSAEDLFSSVESARQLFYLNAEQKSIRLKNEIKDDVIVWADRDMMDIIFRNLISNAIKFTEKNGEVSVSSKDANGFVEVKISDTGIGIDEEKQNMLFNLNMNVTTKGTHNESGTGLGLNLCQELVRKNGGNIKVESNIGKGTSIIFTLINAKFM